MAYALLESGGTAFVSYVKGSGCIERDSNEPCSLNHELLMKHVRDIEHPLDRCAAVSLAMSMVSKFRVSEATDIGDPH